jgi:hypothetical protein
MNNRWRQIIKFINKDDRWEYKWENKRKSPICPCCRSKLITGSWSDERGLVETIQQCKCGYAEHWAYGKTMLSVGNDWYEEYAYDSPLIEVLRIHKEFTKQVSLYKYRSKHMRKRMYTKSKRR